MQVVWMVLLSSLRPGPDAEDVRDTGYIEGKVEECFKDLTSLLCMPELHYTVYIGLFLTDFFLSSLSFPSLFLSFSSFLHLTHFLIFC